MWTAKVPPCCKWMTQKVDIHQAKISSDLSPLVLVFNAAGIENSLQTTLIGVNGG